MDLNVWIARVTRLRNSTVNISMTASATTGLQDTARRAAWNATRKASGNLQSVELMRIIAQNVNATQDILETA